MIYDSVGTNVSVGFYIYAEICMMCEILFSVITCPPVPIWNGLVSTESDISVRSVINVTCTNDTAMTGDGADQGFVISTCTQSGTWEPELPECVTSQSKVHNAMPYETSIRLE